MMNSKIVTTGLATAPWLFAAWLVAFLASCAFPPVNGFCRYLPLGPVQIDTWLTAMPACGLFFVWVQKRMPMPAWLFWLSITVGAMITTAWFVLENPNRAMRIINLIMGR